MKNTIFIMTIFTLSHILRIKQAVLLFWLALCIGEIYCGRLYKY